MMGTNTFQIYIIRGSHSTLSIHKERPGLQVSQRLACLEIPETLLQTEQKVSCLAYLLLLQQRCTEHFIRTSDFPMM